MLEEALIQMVVEGTEYGQKGIADTIEILREMRCEIGEKALEEWVQRTFVLVQSEEVLLGEMCESVEDSEDTNERIVVEGDCEESDGKEVVCDVRSGGEVGDSSQRREPDEQLTEQLNLLMQKLPYENAPKSVIVYCLRIACESEGSVSKALPTVSEGSLGADDSIGVDIYNTALTGDKVCPLAAGGTTSTGTCPKVMTPVTFEPVIASREGGHIYEGVSGTLRANAGDNQMATAYGISSYNSNAMKSDNPHSGIYEADTSRTLDGNGGNPSCNQGGIAIVEPVPYTLKIRGGVSVDSYGKAAGKGALIQTYLSATLGVSQDQYLFQPVYSVENHPADSRVNIDESGKVQTLTSRMGTGGGNVPMGLALDRASFNQGKNAQFDFEVSDKGINSPIVAKGPSAVCYGIDQQGGKGGANYTENVSPTILSDSHGTPHAVCYGINGDKAGTLDASYYKGCGMRSGVEREVVAVDCRNATEDSVNGALQSGASRSLNCNNVVRTRYIVRRLTPLECERLQGYPDGWTDIGEWVDSSGKKRQTSDAARYKALGNSIALPPWKWVLKRLCACYERDATMASLFDGIGGFPYLWEQLNGKGTCLWASEIEEFPMAVTKVRIGGDT